MLWYLLNKTLSFFSVWCRHGSVLSGTATVGRNAALRSSPSPVPASLLAENKLSLLRSNSATTDNNSNSSPTKPNNNSNNNSNSNHNRSGSSSPSHGEFVFCNSIRVGWQNPAR